MQSAKYGSYAFLLLLVLCAGCSSNQIITALNGVVAAVELVFPAIADAAGLPPAVTSAVSKYLHSVSGASAGAADILAGADSAGVKAAKITALFAGIAAPSLPAGTPANVLNAVSLVAQAVAKFLTNFTPGQARAMSQAPAPATQGDKEKLQAIRVRAVAAGARALSMKQ